MDFVRNITIAQFSGYLSGIFMIVSYIPYIRDVFRGKTKPERLTWFLWATLSVVAFILQFAEGASYSLFLTGAQMIGLMTVFLLSIKNGYGGFLKRDIIGLGGVVMSLFVWYLTDNAGLAIVIVVIIDGIGGILTIFKSYESPLTETVSSYLLGGIAGFLACLAVGYFNITLLAVPLYTFFMNFAIALSIWIGLRQKLKSTRNTI
jgi:hypothetical protein